MADVSFVVEGSLAWDSMWNALEADPINNGLADGREALFGFKSWQYMGTQKVDSL